MQPYAQMTATGTHLVSPVLEYVGPALLPEFKQSCLGSSDGLVVKTGRDALRFMLTYFGLEDLRKSGQAVAACGPRISGPGGE